MCAQIFFCLQSLGVAFDAYSTPWYNIPVTFQKDIKFMIMRAEKPLTLNAANLGVVISLETYLRVCLAILLAI